MGRISYPVVIVSLVSAAAACGPRAPQAGFAERDSAGVRIVTSPSTAWGEDSQWHVDSSPRLIIGVQEGLEPYQFFRVGGARRLEDGTIVVSDGGTAELRFFTAAGRHIRSVGRHGAGPGEFGQFSSMTFWRNGPDELVVWDGGNARVNIFRTDGEYLRSVRLAPSLDAPRSFLLGLFGDGTWLTWGPRGGGRLTGTPGTVIESQWVYRRVDSSGIPINDLGQAPGRPRYVHEFAGARHFPYIPLTGEPLAEATPNAFLLLRSGQTPLARYDPTGHLQSRIDWTGPGTVATRDVWDRFVEEDLALITDPGDRRRYRDYYGKHLPLPDRAPMYDQLISDREGNVWLRRLRLPGVAPGQWDVLDPRGRWLGVVMVPAALHVYEIGTDYLLGRHLDEFGVERVSLYALTKAP